MIVGGAIFILLLHFKEIIYAFNTCECRLIESVTQSILKALYKGMDAKLFQTVLTSAFTFLTYEQILNILARTLLSLMTATKSPAVLM